MVLRIIRRLNQEENMTILVSSHVLSQLSAVCDRYIFMEKGRKVEEGTEQEIVNRYLTSPRIEIEATMPNGWQMVTGYTPEIVSTNKAVFQLQSREDIPLLLRHLTERGQVYQARIMGSDLESIYFAIREAHHHE